MSQIAKNQAMPKKVSDIGLRQARLLCQMPHEDRISFLAEGLPIVLASAQGFWRASCQLSSAPREAEVLRGFAQEEAAKILILMDAVRCPRKIIASKIGKIVGWFYDHLARLIYADAVTWKPMHVAQLREYVRPQREAHYLEGIAGEYIMPNSTIYQRESRLYADIESYEDGEPEWNSPNGNMHSFLSFVPPALVVGEAMSNLGIFSLQGLKATSEIWGQMTFTNTEDHLDAERLTRLLVERLIKEELPREPAAQEHVNAIFHDWQLPMYDFDFSPIQISLEDLKEEQERMLWSEFGDSY